MLEDSFTLEHVTIFINNAFCSGVLPAPLRQLWGACCTVALAKPKGGYRPIWIRLRVRMRIRLRAKLYAASSGLQLRRQRMGDSGSRSALNLHLEPLAMQRPRPTRDLYLAGTKSVGVFYHQLSRSRKHCVHDCVCIWR